jgi:ribosomal protein S21|tara:strand:+ start:254 stop:541 length:288 start_codon:yes stop_codon:yes gene_type:complete
MYKSYRKQKGPTGIVEVTAQECAGNAEKMIRRFMKKVKKERILEEVRERSHFKKKTIIRAEAKRNKRRLINKVNQQRDALSKPHSFGKRRGAARR